MSLVAVEPPAEAPITEAPPPADNSITPPTVITTPADRWPRPYYLSSNLRRVQPYHYTYNTYCKERWRGRSLIDIYAAEFRDRPREYYEEAIANGSIVLNGQPIPTPTHPIQNGDLISHTLHRHEPPVTATPIGIVHESTDVIVIDKPAGVPVHPAGRYNYNSIIEIMRAERGMGWNPLPCNRLDRLTSGIMFIGKHAAAAERISEQIRGRRVRKEYVARVMGRFPCGDTVCEQPILQISPKLGLNRVRANGKSARTVFRRLAYYPSMHHAGYETKGYSIVLALPLTGRTHQLRVHLQYLGFPIANDPIYSNQRVFGPELGRSDATGENDESIMERLGRMGKEEVADAVAWHDEMVEEYQKKKREKMSGDRCDVCGTELYDDPGVEELGLWLHALRYSCAGEAEEGEEEKEKQRVLGGEGAGGTAGGAWAYETALPAWAVPPQGQEGLAGNVVEVERGLEEVAERLEEKEVTQREEIVGH